MSITIVSLSPQPSQVATTDGSSDGALAGDFAGLLLGQIAAAAAVGSDATSAAEIAAGSLPGQLAIAIPQALIVNSTLPSTATASTTTEDQSELAAADGAPADAAALLAALGLLAQPVTPGASPPASKSDTSVAAPLTALPAAATSGKDVQLPGKNAIVAAPAALDTTTVADGAAAKFAVAPPLADDALSATATPPDTQSSATNAITAQSGNVIANTTQLLQRESSQSVDTPVRDQRWAADFSQKVVWLATNDKQSAQLTLNPAQLGPIEISLNIDKGNASVSFASANAEVRDAIETALPRLREMFASAGIALGQTNVGAESFSQQAGNEAWKQSSSRSTADNAILATTTAGSLQARAFGARQGNGMVDIFA